MRQNHVKHVTAVWQVFRYIHWAKLVCWSSISRKFLAFISPIHTMSLSSASESLVQVIGQMMLFVQPGESHMCIQIAVVDNLVMSLLVAPSYTERFVSTMFSMEYCIVFICFGEMKLFQNMIHSKIYWLRYGLPRTGRLIQKTEKTTTIWRGSFEWWREPQFLPNTELSVPVMISSAIHF